MKTKLTSLLIFLALTIAFSCSKDSDDYREDYTGSWSFNILKTKVNIDSIGQMELDTLKYEGKITKGNADNEITIQYTGNHKITLIIDESGSLSGFPTHYCNGAFESKDKMQLYLRWGGWGGFEAHEIEGIKINL